VEEKRVELEKLTPKADFPAVYPSYPRPPAYPADMISSGYGGYPKPEQSTGGINIRALWRTILKHKWLILVITFIVTSAATIEAYRTKSTYMATASIEVRKDATIQLKENLLLQTDDYDLMNTIIFKIKSQTVLTKVAANLQLDQNQKFLDSTSRKSVWESLQTILSRLSLKGETPPPVQTTSAGTSESSEKDLTPEEQTKWAGVAAMISSNLKVEQLPQARLIQVSYTHTDPQIAALVANAVCKQFITQNFKEKIAGVVDSADYVDEKTRQLRAKLEQAEKRLNDFLSTHNMAFVDGGGKEGSTNQGTQTYLELLGKARAAEQDRILKQSAYEQIKKGKLGDLPEAYSDPQLIDLNKKLQELKQEEAKLLETYGKKNPKIVAIGSQIEELEAQLQTSRAKLEAKIKADYEKAVREEQSFKELAESSKGTAATQNKEQIEFNMLKQDVAIAQSFYNDYLTKQSHVELERADQKNNLFLAEPASVPSAPVGPDRLKAIFTWLIIGFTGGIGLAFFLDYLDNTIKTVEDVTQHTQLPTLGVIPAMEGRKLKKLSVGKGKRATALATNGNGNGNSNGNGLQLAERFATMDGRSTAAEAYRVLRTSIMLSNAGNPPKLILVTSGQPGEGKTTTTVNTAISLAQLGASVLVIDCDLRKPSVHKALGIHPTRGLSTYLSRDTELDKLIQKTQVTNLSVLPCGAIPPNPAELISSEKMRNMLASLSEHYDHILLDSPPLMYVTDPVILSTLVEGVIMVVHSGKSPREVARRATQELVTVGAKIFGVVLNNVDFRKGGYDDYYYYRYYEGYGEDAHKETPDDLNT
jgi:capsular exopolysaccharide synthesis family protein